LHQVKIPNLKALNRIETNLKFQKEQAKKVKKAKQKHSSGFPRTFVHIIP